MRKNTQKGFTLIELLVVIAIIGILATIVLTSLGSARTKANDAKIEGQLSGMRAQAQLYTGANANVPLGTCTGTTGTLFGFGTTDMAANSLGSQLPSQSVFTNTQCYAVGGGTAAEPSTGNAWAISWPISTGGAFCVDSTGVARTATATGTPYTLPAGATPAIAASTTSCQ